jgi:hypothetical protein
MEGGFGEEETFAASFRWQPQQEETGMKVTQILALILALAAPFTLAACGDEAEVEVEDGEVDD